jgi:hypothetical protein
LLPLLIVLFGCGTNDINEEPGKDNNEVTNCTDPEVLVDGECVVPDDDVTVTCESPQVLVDGNCQDPVMEEGVCDIYYDAFFCDGNTYTDLEYTRAMLTFIFEQFLIHETDEFCDVFFENDLVSKCNTDLTDFYPFIYGKNPATYLVSLNNTTGYYEFTIEETDTDTEYKVAMALNTDGDHPRVSVWQLELIDDLGTEITKEMVKERFSGFFSLFNSGSVSCSEYSTFESVLRDDCNGFFTNMTTLTIDDIIVKDIGFGRFLLIPVHDFDTPIGPMAVYNPVVITPAFEGPKLKIDTFFYPNTVYLSSARLAALNFDDIVLNSNLSDTEFAERVGLEEDDAIELRTAILDDYDSYSFTLNQATSNLDITQFQMVISVGDETFTYNVYVSIGWGDTIEFVLMEKVEG